MKTVSQPAAEKIGKLIVLLGSDKDGEIVATAHAIKRTAIGDGCDLHDVARLVTSKVYPEPVFEDTPSPERTYRGPSYYEFNARDPWMRKQDACRDAIRLCRSAQDRLSPWERSFLDSITARVTHSLGLSAKQQATLLSIAAKVS